MIARLALLLLLLLLRPAEAEAAKIRIMVQTPGGLEQYVYLGRPVNLQSDRPVVFVMHGVRRNAEEYRDQWHELAETYRFLLVVPEFSDANFPEAEGYNYGNVYGPQGEIQPRSVWAFEAIEPIFDEVRRRYGMTAEGYALYGRSAGAQFVHRFLFHLPEARVTRAVAANAGWYTMPDPDVAFPYGLQGSAVGPDRLRRALQLPLTVLLGEEDTDPEHASLRRSPEALSQGPHRFARGEAFFETGRAAARRLGVPFDWRLATVPGADHDNRKMAPAAIPYLLGDM
jgi:poly(3-hydroxybutyrate) depolymerase